MFRISIIAIILPFLVVLLVIARWRFSQKFKEDVRTLISTNPSRNILTEQDIKDLPQPVQKYIRYTGYLGREKTSTMKAEFEGQIRSSENSEWMKFSATQYSSFDEPCRYFFLRASMKGIPVAGYHRFKNGIAVMDIRAASLIKVQYAEGPEMNVSETVTHFNDMCLLAPGSLINDQITWKQINENEVSAAFTNQGITVHSTLLFNETGELVNFISDDRYYMSTDKQMRKARWMTPVSGYRQEHGIRYPSYGEAIWIMPEGKFSYAKMNINSVVINPKN